jgi:hypothetical protein
MSAEEMIRSYQDGTLKDLGSVAELLALAHLLPQDDPLFAGLRFSGETVGSSVTIICVSRLIRFRPHTCRFEHDSWSRRLLRGVQTSIECTFPPAAFRLRPSSG